MAVIIPPSKSHSPCPLKREQLHCWVHLLFWLLALFVGPLSGDTFQRRVGGLPHMHTKCKSGWFNYGQQCMYLWLSGALFCVFIVVMIYLLPLHYTCMCWGAEGRGNACTAVMQNCGWLHNYYVFPPFWGGGVGSVFISTCMRNTEKGWSVSKSYDSGTWHCMHLDISIKQWYILVHCLIL